MGGIGMGVSWAIRKVIKAIFNNITTESGIKLITEAGIDIVTEQI